MPFDIALFPLEPSGFLIVTPLDGGPEVSYPTVQCPHCDAHWVYRPGSGKRRMYCTRCRRYTCGQARCDGCVPTEQWFDNLEKGRPEDWYPASVYVGAEVPDGLRPVPGGDGAAPRAA